MEQTQIFIPSVAKQKKNPLTKKEAFYNKQVFFLSFNNKKMRNELAASERPNDPFSPFM